MLVDLEGAEEEGGGDNGKLRSAENSRSVFKIKNALGGRGPVPIESSEEKHNR